MLIGIFFYIEKVYFKLYGNSGDLSTGKPFATEKKII